MNDIEQRANTAPLRSNVQPLSINSAHILGYIQGATEQQEIDIEKACDTFCKVSCCGKPPRETCLRLGTCDDYDRFKKMLEE